MKKIGFIDYYLDEWHANNYPRMIREQSDGAYGVCYAYGKIDSPKGGMTNREWAEKNGVELLDRIEDVVEKSDVLLVLSPDNPEMHEELTALPLQSGKTTYVDKTFAPDRGAAERIFANAKAHGSACFSSSALRFAAELENVDKDAIRKIYSQGPNSYEIYAIHQIEPIIMLMDSRAKRVMALGDASHPSLIVEFEDGRYAQMRHGAKTPFQITVSDESNVETDYPITSDYFGRFIHALIQFYDTGKPPVSPEQTVDVIAIRDAGLRALSRPFQWVEV